MSTQIPIYRAKKIDSDEYVEGYLVEDKSVFYIYRNHTMISNLHQPYFAGEAQSLDEIDLSTLAIHFPDMLDSQGNKIFASLSEDGKGGCVMRDDDYIGIAKYSNCRFVVEYENVEDCIHEENFEVTGIQQ